jgi:hypothetical protein
MVTSFGLRRIFGELTTCDFNSSSIKQNFDLEMEKLKKIESGICTIRINTPSAIGDFFA